MARRASKDVRRLADHPALVRVLPQLSAPALIRLYESVGLHDAGSLMALTPPPLLARAFGEAAWSEQRGSTRLDAEVFVDWLTVWLDEGEAFAARQLLALGEDLLAVCLGEVLVVSDTTVDGFDRWNADDGEIDASGETEPLPSGSAICIDRFLLTPLQEDEVSGQPAAHPGTAPGCARRRAGRPRQRRARTGVSCEPAVRAGSPGAGDP